MPLGCFGVPARYRRAAGSLLTVSWWWVQTRAESPLSLTHRIYPSQSLGSAAFTSEDRLVLGGRAVTLPTLISFSTCTASWHLSDWDVPKVDFSKGSCWVLFIFLGCNDSRVCSPFLLEVTDRCFGNTRL